MPAPDHRPSIPVFLFVLLTGMAVSCASLSGGHTDTYHCPYDTVWEETLQALETIKLTKANKHDGVIETDWEQGMANQKSGVLGRSELVQERSSIVVNLENNGEFTTVRVIHVRQQHPLQGTQSLRWQHAPSSPAVEYRTLARIHDRVTTRGCRAA